MWSLVVLGLIVGFVSGYVLRVALAQQIRSTGTIVVSKEDGTTMYTLEIDDDVDDVLARKNEVLFRVRH